MYLALWKNTLWKVHVMGLGYNMTIEKLQKKLFEVCPDEKPHLQNLTLCKKFHSISDKSEKIQFKVFTFQEILFQNLFFRKKPSFQNLIF